MAEIKIDTTSRDHFTRGVELLAQFASAGGVLRTQNFSVAIAVLAFRAVPGPNQGALAPVLHLPGQGSLISTHDLQRGVCDAMYEKAPTFVPRGAEGPIYKPFTQSFKAFSSGKHNNWRNSFDLQAGLACDAPYSDQFLRSEYYLAEERFDCVYRDAATGYCSSPSGLTQRTRTCFNPNKRSRPPGPESTAKNTAKMLTRGFGDDGKEGYWVIEPTEAVLSDLLGDPQQRVPLYPFIACVYGGSVHLRHVGRYASRHHLRSDLKLDDVRFVTLFDPDTESLYNQSFLRDVRSHATRGRRSTSDVTGQQSPITGRASRTSREPRRAPDLRAGVAFRPGRDVAAFIATAEVAADPAVRTRLLEQATRGHVRALDALGNEALSLGFAPRAQLGGYDLYVETQSIGHLFEVKTWRQENLRQQVRTAVAQLYEYRWRNRLALADVTRLYLVLDRHPPMGESEWIWDFLYADRGVTPCWIEGGKLNTFPRYAAALPWEA
jgi:hypothetical protein